MNHYISVLKYILVFVCFILHDRKPNQQGLNTLGLISSSKQKSGRVLLPALVQLVSDAITVFCLYSFP